MSNIYNTEPPTRGKVTLKTTIGDLDIELWAKEAPKAVRNFVQLCLEGFYDGCIFHRVIKDFMAQTGDPTGTGEGGESIYDGPFKDEFHSRLRFSHRGLLACANRNEPHTNGSQFFITLDKCDWLDRKNTIFGKIVGDTIYNMLRLNDLEVDEATDRPVDAPRILSVDVIWNPFDDITPRITPEERKAQEQFKKAEESRKERKTRKRNLALLSFGDQAEEEEQHLAAATATAAAKIKSAHEVLKGDTKLLAAEETPEEVLAEQQARAAALKGVQDKLRGAKRGRGSGSSSSEDDDSEDDATRRKRGPKSAAGAAAAVAERVKAAADKADKARAARAAAAAAAGDGERGREGDWKDKSSDKSRARSGSSSSSRSRSRSRGVERDKQKAAAAEPAAADTGGVSKPKSKEDELYEVKSKQGPGRIRVDDSVADAELLKAFELSRQKYKSRKQQVGNRQKETLARLAAFTSKLRTTSKKQQQQQDEQQRQRETEQAAAAAAAADKAVADEREAAEIAAAAAAAAAAATAQASKQQQAQSEEAYDGKVRGDIDHRAYMPAAWRVDDYLNQQEDDEDDLASLRQHKLEFSKAVGAGVDAMARSDNLDDYVVFDPLLEAAKGKFSRAAQKEKKKQTQWAGRGQG